ncbi:hypothetical protein HK405_003242 [Cladochytrium tenue]|nr:hypothetical protein HK405_003242 [Cladochytrium tenue]
MLPMTLNRLPLPLLEDVLVQTAKAESAAAAAAASVAAGAVAASATRTPFQRTPSPIDLGTRAITASATVVSRAGLARLLKASMVSRDVHEACWVAPPARARVLGHCLRLFGPPAPAAAVGGGDGIDTLHAHVAGILAWAEEFADFPAVLELLVSQRSAAAPASLSPRRHPDAAVWLLRLLPLGRAVATESLQVLMRAGFRVPDFMDDSLLIHVVSSDAPEEVVLLLSRPPAATAGAAAAHAVTLAGPSTRSFVDMACEVACRSANFEILRLLLPRILSPSSPATPPPITATTATSTAAATRLLRAAVQSGNVAVFRIVLDAVLQCPLTADEWTNPAALYPFLASAAAVSATDLMKHMIIRCSVPVDPVGQELHPGGGPSFPPAVAVSDALLRSRVFPFAVNSAWASALPLEENYTNPAGRWSRRRFLQRFQSRVVARIADKVVQSSPPAVCETLLPETALEQRTLLALANSDDSSSGASATDTLGDLEWAEFSRHLLRATYSMGGGRAEAFRLLEAAGASMHMRDGVNPLARMTEGEPAGDYFDDVPIVALFLGIGGVSEVGPDGLLDASRLLFDRPAWRRPNPDSGFPEGHGTPLYHVLTETDQPALAQLLLFAGASARPPVGASQQSILHLAEAAGNADMARFIRGLNLAEKRAL